MDIIYSTINEPTNNIINRARYLNNERWDKNSNNGRLYISSQTDIEDNNEKRIRDQVYNKCCLWNNCTKYDKDMNVVKDDFVYKDYIKKMYINDICVGDEKLAKKMNHQSRKHKDSINYRASYDKNSLKPFVENELEHASNMRWWDNQDLEMRL